MISLKIRSFFASFISKLASFNTKETININDWKNIAAFSLHHWVIEEKGNDSVYEEKENRENSPLCCSLSHKHSSWSAFFSTSKGLFMIAYV